MKLENNVNGAYQKLREESGMGKAGTIALAGLAGLGVLMGLGNSGLGTTRHQANYGARAANGTTYVGERAVEAGSYAVDGAFQYADVLLALGVVGTGVYLATRRREE